MSTEEQPQVEEKPQVEPLDAQMQDASAPPTEPAAMSNKKRPRLDLALNPRERKRGKTMFGIVLGTLNKAKNEDKERSASEAAKKRQMIEARLQDKLRKETDSVRRAEEVKKDKTVANRKEEELQLKDSIYKLRRTRLPLLANFLSTSDRIQTNDESPPAPDTDPLAPLPRTHPPPIYYLPAILTPVQEAFLRRRKAQVKEAAEQEWDAFKAERSAGIEEISLLRQRVAEEEDRKKAERRESNADEDVRMADEDNNPKDSQPAGPSANGDKPAEAPQMDVDDEERPISGDKEEIKKGPTPSSSGAEVPTTSQTGAADEDDAVEY